MNNNSFFAFISRMKYINRWGLMRNSRYENLSEHSFEVAVITNALANIENDMFGGSFDANDLTVRALYHDCAEIITIEGAVNDMMFVRLYVINLANHLRHTILSCYTRHRTETGSHKWRPVLHQDNIRSLTL